MLRNSISRVAVAGILISSVFASPSIAQPELGKDNGKKPWAVNIEKLTAANANFRSTMWTGKNLQLTVMSLKPGEEIGLEKHDVGDQFIRVEQGNARVVMGAMKNKMTFDKKVSDDWAILIPSGFWHNIINEGNNTLKLYVLYAPPEHPAGTVDKTFKR
ncbi:MAG: cupin domain-containing protein [Cyanobacteria bacterium]|nr:cupin domain-containing protein [Cyanobacteriota bacterium]